MRPTHVIRIALPFVSALAVLALGPAPVAEPLLGFTAEGSKAERELEQRFDATLDTADLAVWLQQLSSHPNHIGSPGDRANAECVAARFREWGYETRIDEYQVLFPTPKERLVELVSPRRYRLKLEEPAVKGDATSGEKDDRLPTYNAYSADGDVTGDVVYVNYGRPEDYEELERRGIDVKGKIVLARYGGSWRGIKPKAAAERGAIGCLIYSDPRDDGYFQGDVYPEGAYRMSQGAQRGSVADMPQYPGDPLTPGVGAIAGAQRLSVAESPVIMKIPVLPISYGDAQPILESLAGPVAPEAWRGALPLTYHLGPGPARMHLKVSFNWDLATARDVIALLRGSEYPDEWVVRGNHMDGWVFGAGDPLSGLTVELEEARGVASLVQSGWRPKRTIVYAAWDGEEPGLLGSTEWVEDHASELQAKVVAYINTDGNGRGFLGVGGSHQLERFVTQLAADVRDPETGVSVLERARARQQVRGTTSLPPGDMQISPLGSGSDYTPFLQHLGIASLNIGYGGEDGGGSYHSIFDSYSFYRRFGDPGFRYGVTLAQTVGRATLRLANADVLPFRFTSLAERVGEYLEQVQKLADDERAKTEKQSKLIDENAFELAADPTETYMPPPKKEPVPHLNFAPVANAVDRLKAAAKGYDAALAKRMGGEGGGDDALGGAGGVGADAAAGGGVDAATAAKLNALLLGMEQRLTADAGLPRRQWFRHQLYAPGFWTGYGVKTLPGIREGIEQREWDNVDKYVVEVSAALERLSDGLEQATKLLTS